MPINFSILLQDSLNFIRNQRVFSQISVLAILLNALVFTLWLPQGELSVNPATMTPEESQQLLLSLTPNLFGSLINVLIPIWIILNIKRINQGKNFAVGSVLSTSLIKLIPILLLSFISFLLISLAMSLALTGSVNMMILPLMLLGIFIFIKLSLVNYIYLIENKSISETILLAWKWSKGRMQLLSLYCVLNYLIPGMIGLLFNAVDNTAVQIIGIIVSALLSFFCIVFSFRFYQSFRQLV